MLFTEELKSSTIFETHAARKPSTTEKITIRKRYKTAGIFSYVREKSEKIARAWTAQ